MLFFIPRVSCVFFSLTLLGSSASSDLKLRRTLPLASACQMCSSPCCTWNDYFHSWLRQVSEECEARGTSSCGWPWLVCELFGAGAVPQRLQLLYRFALGSLGISASAPVPPTPLLSLIAGHLFLLLCCSSFSLSHLSMGLCCKLNCWKVQQSGLKTSGKGERGGERAAATPSVCTSVPDQPCAASPLPPALRSLTPANGD